MRFVRHARLSFKHGPKDMVLHQLTVDQLAADCLTKNSIETRPIHIWFALERNALFAYLAIPIGLTRLSEAKNVLSNLDNQLRAGAFQYL